MAGKSRYSDEDKARVYAALAANEFQIKTAAKETGVPETTVRRFAKEFKQSPPEPELVAVVVTEQLDKISRVEDKALTRLEEKLDKDELSGRDLITAFGVLNDKKTRLVGLDRGEREHHHFHHLPPADELAGLLQGLTQEALESGRQRQSELVEAELREQARPALPAPRP